MPSPNAAAAAMPAAKNSSQTSSCLLSSLGSSPSPSSRPSLEALLDELTAITARAKEIEARRQELLDALDQLVEEGEIDERFTWNDFTISRAVRTSYAYPTHISEQRDALKQAEQLSVALGEATVKTTTFWTVRQPKP